MFTGQKAHAFMLGMNARSCELDHSVTLKNI